MNTKASGLENKDPFLIEYKENMREVVEGMKRIGESGLKLLMVEMIRSRWIRDKRATYPYEVAWVFDRKEESVSKVLHGLEESGDIELVGLGRWKKGSVKPYKPRSLRKAPSSGGPSREKRTCQTKRA